jgi:hypothetical protein
MSSERFVNFLLQTDVALLDLAAYRLVRALSVFAATILTQNAAKTIGPNSAAYNWRYSKSKMTILPSM